ncbi:unnamed protein product [Urochloa decumbens]|uniref:Fe2OG dioxygenase domain-containing protein n=1 Tax=Urochloa decumbens TaxID=240449 RepID=A0ABC9E2F0_9POAL
MAAESDSPCPPFPLFGEDGDDPASETIPHGEELELPTVDLDSPGRALDAACRRPGIFRLANHGVPADLTARLFAAARDLLARTPFRDKQAQPGYFWGTPGASPSRSRPVHPRDVNWLEGYHVHLAQPRPFAVGPPAGHAAAALGELVAEYGEHMARVARRVFDALAADKTESYLNEHGGYVRVHRYPWCPEPGHKGIEAHTDSTTLSIINQDLAGGLQVLHDGAWRDVAPGETLLVNLGDMARAISADAYVSVPHRVAASRAGGDGRLSLCYFAFPRDDALVSCDGGSRYRPFTLPEFRAQVQADIRETGAKVGLERFLRH